MSSFHDNLRSRGLPELPGKQQNFRIKMLEFQSGDLDERGLNRYIRKQDLAGRQILANIAPDQHDPETEMSGKEMFEAARRGLHAHLQALELFRHWVTQPFNQELKDSCLALAGQGDAFLNEALRICFDLCLTLDEAALELLKSMGKATGSDGEGNAL